jgi:hypothetical protein
MRRALLIAAAICLCLPALATDFPHREVFGVVGIGKTYDDEGSLGSGINGGDDAGHRFSQSRRHSPGSIGCSYSPVFRFDDGAY